MTLRSGLLVAALVLSLPGLAQADELKGVTVSASIGTGIHGRATLEGEAPSYPGHANLTYDPGFASGLGLGYAYGNGVRVEATGIYRGGELNKLQGSSQARGHLNAAGGLASVYYDYDTDTPWTPFVGAGFGGLVLQADHLGILDGDSVNDSKAAFVYHASLGIGYALTPAANLGLSYQYLTTPDKTRLATEGGHTARLQYLNHALQLTFRYTFGEAPAAATPETAPAPAQN